MQRKILIAAVTGAALGAAATAVLLLGRFEARLSSYAWMTERYFYAVIVCKEDLQAGAAALRRLDEFFGLERSSRLPHAILHRVVLCQELAPFPDYGPDLENWLPGRGGGQGAGPAPASP